MNLLGCLIALASMACAQVSSGVSLGNGIRLRVSANVSAQPANQQNLTASIEPASGNSVYRIYRDQNKLAVFAYELRLDRNPDGETMRLTVVPAGNEFAQKFPNADGGKPTPTVPTTRDFSAVRSGQRVDVELFDTPPNGKVSDSVEVTLNRPGTPAANQVEHSPSDKIRFAGLKVSINGRAIDVGPPRAVVSGRFAMFYIPGRGGYFFAAEDPQNEKFVKAGWVDRNKMQFTLDNESFECMADVPILAGEARGELWAYHDPRYRPQGMPRSTNSPRPGDEFSTAASDSLKWWLP
jgi:hypothetical protein